MKSRMAFGILYAVCEVTLIIMILVIAFLAATTVLAAFKRDFETAIVGAVEAAILSFGLKQTGIREVPQEN